jgi:hypothetical protein
MAGGRVPLRIENTARTNNVGQRSVARPAGSGSAFVIGEPATASRAASVAAAAPASAIDGLLALQAVEDPTAGRKKQLRRGRSLLDTLEMIKADLLVGRVSDGHLNQLMTLIGQARERQEPGLDGVLDDIELRARVELAKRGIYPSF